MGHTFSSKFANSCSQKSQLRFEENKINLWIDQITKRDLIFSRLGKLCKTFDQFTIDVDVNFHKKITYIGIEVSK